MSKDQKVVILSEERYEFLSSLENDFEEKIEERLFPYKEQFKRNEEFILKAGELLLENKRLKLEIEELKKKYPCTKHISSQKEQ